MAVSLNTVWLLLISISIQNANSLPDSAIFKFLNLVTFDCQLDIDGAKWTMECYSQNFDLEKSSKFFVSILSGNLDPNSPLTLRKLLLTTSFSESEFYFCDSLWRVFLKLNPTTLPTSCADCGSYLKKLIARLDTGVLKSISFSHSPVPKLAFNILTEAFHAQKIIVTGNSLGSFSFFPIPFNNSVIKLCLKENGISFISDGLFTNFQNLTYLDLSHNQLTSVSRNLFDNVSTIEELDLSYNIISYLSEDAFQGLPLLKKVYLNNNKVKNISENIFSFNTFLSTVDMSHNNLKNISENIFRLNTYLSMTDLSHNDFKYLPTRLFQNMSYLKNVSCSYCNLVTLGEDAFLNSPNLEVLLFHNNSLKVLDKHIFKNLTFLRDVHFGNNNISSLTQDLFHNQPYLMYVNVSGNRISNLQSGVFSGSPDVRYIDFRRNQITSPLTDDYIKNFSDIEHFWLQNNMISTIELGISNPVRIRKLDISYNLVTRINVRWKKLILIEYLNMDGNFLTSVDLPPCIPSIKQTLTFSFKYNRISRINIDSLIVDEARVKKGDRTMGGCFFNGMAKNYVDLTHNPLLCDCELYPFYNYIQGPNKYQLEMFIDKGNITCAEPQFLRNTSLALLSDDMLGCSETKMCPHNCSCGIRGKDSFHFVNCSSKFFNEVPHLIPNETVVLYFDKNNLSSMASLNHKAWKKLKELHLDYNLLTTLDNWTIPESLDYLSVRGNRLKTLSDPLMKFIESKSDFQLFFGENDVNCDCDRRNFKTFLLQYDKFIKDNITCNITINGRPRLLQLKYISDKDLCPNHVQIALVISLSLCFVFLISLTLIYYKYHHIIVTFIFIHCPQLSHLWYTEENNENAIFDAFIAYSSSDRDIVLKLIEELENNPPFFQLCIHERNWLPGRFITDNIANSVESSKRTIIILSSTFICSPWFNIELRAAVFKMSKDKMNRLIVILAEKSVSLDNIDPELRYVVSKRTYLVWGERWFWEKLRYALPRKRASLEASLNYVPLQETTS